MEYFKIENEIKDLEIFDIRLLNDDENWILLDLKKEDIKSISIYVMRSDINVGVRDVLTILTKNPLPNLDNTCVFSTRPEVLEMEYYDKKAFVTKLNNYELKISLIKWHIPVYLDWDLIKNKLKK